jgi:hypothetical protein
MVWTYLLGAVGIGGGPPRRPGHPPSPRRRPPGATAMAASLPVAAPPADALPRVPMTSLQDSSPPHRLPAIVAVGYVLGLDRLRQGLVAGCVAPAVTATLGCNK